MTDITTIGADNPLAHADFEVPPLHIPDGKGGAYKTELVLERSEQRVVKIHWWHGPDPRREPHNHPWEWMQSTILSGGYTETRHRILTRDGVPYTIHKKVLVHRAGDVTPRILHNEFHTVDEVLPGTVTRMETGPLVAGGEWGNLDLEEGGFTPATPDPEFFAQLCAINPHKRK